MDIAEEVTETGAVIIFTQEGGKSLGDGIADLGEEGWNLERGIGEGIFNGIKGLFG